MTMRTYPIRVGNIYKNDHPTEGMIGWSGPWYHDQRELQWRDLGLSPETTTVTKRPRRVASFSFVQYRTAVRALRPDYVFLNFVNYMDNLSAVALIDKIGEIGPEVTHVGWGPKITDVREVNP
jgi:adenylosuccinate synthase